MPCQAIFWPAERIWGRAIDKPLVTASEWLLAGEAEAGSAGEQPAEE